MTNASPSPALPERLAALTDPGKRAELREAAMKRQRRRPGVLGRFIPWPAIVVSKVAMDKHRSLEGRRLAELAEEHGKHVADVMLDLAVEETLETEFQLLTRSPAEDVELAEFVKTGHAVPSQSDAGAHLNTNFCTAGESSYVLGEWVRERQLLGLEDAIRRLTFQPARIMGLHDRGLVREGLAADLMIFDLSRLGVPEHTHIPASRRSPWPGGPSLPKEYWHAYAPFLALTAAAMATSRLRLGTGICLVVERDPIITAKEVATLDRLSGGRFLFGIGGGWNAEEMKNHGTEFKKRWRVLRERVLAMKEIWTKEEAEFHGEFVRFRKIWSHPKPAQKPHPPIIMGGDGPTTFDRVIEFADGWMPIARPKQNPAEKIPALRQRAEKAGRDPKSISVTIFFAKPDRATVDALRAAGVDRAIFGVPSESRDKVLPLLDSYAPLLR